MREKEWWPQSFKSLFKLLQFCLFCTIKIHVLIWSSTSLTRLTQSFSRVIFCLFLIAKKCWVTRPSNIFWCFLSSYQKISKWVVKHRDSFVPDLAHILYDFMLKEGRSSLVIWKKIFMVRVVKWWHRSLRDVVDGPSWRCSRSGWMGLWAAWPRWWCPC